MGDFLRSGILKKKKTKQYMRATTWCGNSTVWFGRIEEILMKQRPMV